MPGPLEAVIDIVTMLPHGPSQEEDFGEEVLCPFLAGRPELILEYVFLLDPSYPAGWEAFHQVPPSN